MGGLVPIGYDADGRTLRVNEEEAATVKALYRLYEQHLTIRAVKEHADQMSLKTKHRISNSGKISGGGSFTRGHIHQILTNPLYAGRIRHRKAVHEGQHPPIIDPDSWGRVQQMLQDGAAKERRSRSKTASSVLCGKLFDEAGDRLTPSHTKTRSGKRLRYYVSHRLIAQSGGAHLDRWRLPAPELEERCAALIRATMEDATIAARLMTNSSGDVIGGLQSKLTALTSKASQKQILDLASEITVRLGHLTVKLCATAMAGMLEIGMDALNEGALTITTNFQLRKRGVETKLILADVPTGQDNKLIRHLAKAHVWFKQIKSGATFDQIADAEQTSKRRVQQIIELAFLAPDIIRDVLEGKQPVGFTSDWCVRQSIPSDWNAQRDLLQSLKTSPNSYRQIAKLPSADFSPFWPAFRAPYPSEQICEARKHLNCRHISQATCTGLP